MRSFKSALIAAFAVAALGSCVKNNPSTPPDTSKVDPNLPVNCKIVNLSQMALNMSSGQYRLMGDTTIAGVVIADDKSGNFYKQVVIQDDSGGIVIGLDKTNIYAEYPIGRKIYVKLKGLYLVNYKGLPEIVASVSATGSTTGIPSTLVGNYVIKAAYPVKVDTLDISPLDLYGNASQYYNRLIRLSNMQFDDASAGMIYAAPTSTGSFGTSRTLTDCEHNVSNVVVYNSAFATFQAALTPTGNGKITCVCSNYNGSIQLLLRDTTDVQFTGPRCP